MSETDPRGPATEVFVAHRNLLFTVAYEMLGSAADAEDVLQETWLRWATIDSETVRNPRAYLVRIVTRQALTHLRTLARRRESYVGPWLPEPLLTAPDVADDVVLADSVSMAMLVVLEALTPEQRAVFVLRDVFEFGYGEIAEAVDKSVPAVRQIAHRARGQVAAGRPRAAVSAEETRAALEAFQRAVETGDVQTLLEILAPDIVAMNDSGGVGPAVTRPIVGVESVVQLLAAARNVVGSGFSFEPVQINGWPAVLWRRDDVLQGVVSVRIDEGLITALYTVSNPTKLSRLANEVTLSR